MAGTEYGYIRVSTRDQNTDRQRLALLEHGIGSGNIFTDKVSGKSFDRPQYQRMLKKLKAGDALVVKSIDRLGRNYEEILEQWRIITKEKQAAIVVLDMPLLDTRQGRDLTGTLIAETEREFIRQRQAEGIAAAKARGVSFGRRALERPVEYGAVLGEWRAGRLSARKAAGRLGVSHKTFLSWARSEGGEIEAGRRP